MWSKQILAMGLAAALALAAPAALLADCPPALSCATADSACQGDLIGGFHGDLGFDIGIGSVDICHFDVCIYQMNDGAGGTFYVAGSFVSCFEGLWEEAVFFSWE